MKKTTWKQRLGRAWCNIRRGHPSDVVNSFEDILVLYRCRRCGKYVVRCTLEDESIYADISDKFLNHFERQIDQYNQQALHIRATGENKVAVEAKLDQLRAYVADSYTITEN